MGVIQKSLLLGLCLYLIAASHPACSQAVQFGNPETVVRTLSAARGMSLAYDSANRPHISFIDYTSGNRLVYARWTGSSWNIRFFNDVRITSAQIPTSLALDSADRPHIALAGNQNYVWLDSTNTWRYENFGNVQYSPNIEIGSDGLIRMAYIEWSGSNRLVRYAQRSSTGVWAIETAATTGNPPSGLDWGWCGLALTSTNIPYISYEDPDNRNAMYAYKSGASWIRITLDSSPSNTGRLNDIRLDSTNRPQIVYTNDTANTVIVARNTAGGWFWETIAINVTPFKSMSIDIAPNGTLGVGFASGATFRVYRRISGSWTTNSLPVGFGGDGEVFKFDNTNAAGAAHGGTGELGGALQHSRLSGSDWVTQQVYTGGPFGSTTFAASKNGDIVAYSTAVPQQILVETPSTFGGTVHFGPGSYRFGAIASNANRTVVSYYSDTDTSLRVAEYSSFPPLYGTSAWPWTTVDNTADVGKYTSIALDNSNNIYVSYFDETNANLKFARRISGVWSTTIVDNAGSVGWDTSIALNASNNPRISYYDITNQDLKFGFSNGGAWTVSTLESAGNVGEYSHLVYDSSNNPHIVYYDRTNSRIRWAKGPIGYWTSQTVASGAVGPQANMAVDPALNPHFAYYDSSARDLKYAIHNGFTFVYFTPDAIGDVGANPKLGLDGYKITIYYNDWTNASLKRITGYYDYSPPPTPVVTDAGDFVLENRIQASWGAVTDPESGLAFYEYAVGTTPTDPGSGYLINWTSTTSTSFNRTGITLVNGVVYYVYVRAVNRAGQTGGVGVSNGIRRVTPVNRISEAKLLQDGTWVQLSNKIASRSASFYFTFVQEPDRSAGIFVYHTTAGLPAISINPGTQLTLTGQMGVQLGRRAVVNPVVAIGSTVAAPRPLYLSNKSVTGEDFFYNPGPPVSGEMGAVGRIGINNVGLYSRVAGWVTEVLSPLLYRIDDGSLPDGLLVSHEIGYGQPALGQMVEVFGYPLPGGVFWMTGPAPDGWRVLAP